MAERTAAVAYYRVSTDQQGASGLGLESQAADVARFVESARLPILKAFREVESGKRHENRPQLDAAVSFARRAGATLVVAKLDRLARDVHFLSGLLKSGVDFVACDNPHATPFTVHILAAVAELEAKMISERTRKALAAYKARGGLLGAARPGGHRLTPEAATIGRAAALAAIRARTRARAPDLVAVVAAHSGPDVSLHEVARRLNADGQRTIRGKPWTAVQVSRVLKLGGRDGHAVL